MRLVLYNRFHFKIEGSDEIYRAILVDNDLWSVEKLGMYYGRDFIEIKLCSGEWELL